MPIDDDDVVKLSDEFYLQLQPMQVLNAKEGDTIVFKVDTYLTDEQRVMVTKQIEPLLEGNNCKRMILEHGMDIVVISKGNQHDVEAIAARVIAAIQDRVNSEGSAIKIRGREQADEGSGD